MKIFITDAHFKHTLGIIRSLRNKNIDIITGSQYKYAQSFYSKYSFENVVYPDPRDEISFVEFLLDYIDKKKVNMILPVGYHSNVVLSKNRKKFLKYMNLPVVDYESMQIASNKDKTFQFAKSLGIEIPETYVYPFSDESKMRFPIVGKGIRESGKVIYINSIEEYRKSKKNGYIFQEYIPGTGCGLYALFNHGKVRVVFMHERIREYPITGGASTAAVSIYDSKLKDLGIKILKELKWHGVAMVEFKRDSRDGKYKLMEINPKLWGSLDLSTASGINIPYMTIKMATEGDVEPIMDYQKGVRYQWLFPDDMLHLFANPKSFTNIIKDLFNGKVKKNISLADIKPNIFQVLLTIREISLRIKNKNLKYPNHRPKLS